MNGVSGDVGAQGADPAIPADTAVASVRADAAGSATSSAVRLIAERIASEASTEVARASQSGQTTFLAQAAPLKVLHIQLQPADLGTVTVRMSLREKTLQLDLEVSRGEGAQLLQRDKDALSSLLRSAGYLVEGMDVRIADPGTAASQTSTGGAQAGPQMQWGGQPGSSHTDGRSAGGRPGDGTQHATFGDERYGTDGQTGEPSRGGGVYV
jgi:chemotaxis protein MotD